MTPTRFAARCLRAGVLALLVGAAPAFAAAPEEEAPVTAASAEPAARSEATALARPALPEATRMAVVAPAPTRIETVAPPRIAAAERPRRVRPVATSRSVRAPAPIHIAGLRPAARIYSPAGCLGCGANMLYLGVGF